MVQQRLHLVLSEALLHELEQEDEPRRRLAVRPVSERLCRRETELWQSFSDHSFFL